MLVYGFSIPCYNRQLQVWDPLPPKHEETDTLKYFSIDNEDKMIEEPFTNRMGNLI